MRGNTHEYFLYQCVGKVYLSCTPNFENPVLRKTAARLGNEFSIPPQKTLAGKVHLSCTCSVSSWLANCECENRGVEIMTMMDDRIVKDLAELYNNGAKPGNIKNALRLNGLVQAEAVQKSFATRVLSLITKHTNH